MRKGFTLIEILVVISIISILAVMTLPIVKGALMHAQLIRSVGNLKQIYVTADQASRESHGELNYTHAGDNLLSLKDFNEALVASGMVTLDQLSKLYSAPGVTADIDNNVLAYRVFAIRESDPGSFPFLISKNWESFALTTNAPFQTYGFAVLRRDGTAAFSTRINQAADTEFVGNGTNALPAELQ